MYPRLLAASLSLWLALPAPALARQTVTVTGVVTDAESGAPLPGTVLSLGEPARQTITNAQGGFQLIGAPPGPATLRVQRLGYRTLERSVTVVEGMAPLALAMEPDPIQLDELTVLANARGALSGIVLNAVSGEPVPWTDITVTEDFVRQVGRRQASDELGAFRVPDLQTGAYLLRVERIGYHGQYLPVLHGVPPHPVEVRLEPDSALLRGLAEMTAQLETRRRSHARTGGTVDEARLRSAPPTGMRRFLDAYTPLWLDPIRGNSIWVRGSYRPPVVYIDGVRALDPGMEQLGSYESTDIHSLDYFECPGRPGAALSGFAPVQVYMELHVFTYAYMLRLAERPRLQLPPCV